MLEYAGAIWMIGVGVGAAFAGVAAMLMAVAWIIWARRCDPRGTFRAAGPTRTLLRHRSS
jgi:hypothetical protein